MRYRNACNNFFKLTMKVVGIIPVRLESTRLHQKAIIDIGGLPMFVHTCKRAKLAKSLDEVFLATDSKYIAEICNDHNIECIMTSKKHKNSTERIAEACDKINCDIVVNIQGDEPLLYPDHIDKIVKPLFNDKTIEVSIGVTTFTKKNSKSDLHKINNWPINCINQKQSQNTFFLLISLINYT